MKRILLVPLTLIFLLSSGNAVTPIAANPPQTFGTMTAFGTHVFQLIQANSYNEILTLLPNADEWKTGIMNSALPETRKTPSTVDKNVGSYLSSSRKSLNKTLKIFKQATDSIGIDWSQYTIHYINYNHTNKYNIQQADIYLYVTNNSDNYKITLADCLKFGNSWRMGNEIFFKKQK
jgi:hypothetical protein